MINFINKQVQQISSKTGCEDNLQLGDDRNVPAVETEQPKVGKFTIMSQPTKVDFWVIFDWGLHQQNLYFGLVR